MNKFRSGMAARKQHSLATAEDEVRRDAQDWRPALKRYVNEHNSKHATKAKGVSHATMAQREKILFRVFELLRTAGFRIAPYNIGGRHLDFLVRFWTAADGVEEELRARGSKLQARKVPYSASYIQGMLSTLRTFSAWIGKPGLVRPATNYVDRALVMRHMNATRDLSWSGAEVDPEAIIAKVTQEDPVVGLQLELMVAFGLRRKESVMFCPTLATVPAYALPADATSTDYLCFLRIKRGTKGGRLRYVAIRSEQQRDVYERACRAAPHDGAHIGRPGQSLKQALDRFSNVVRKCGLTKKQLQVTPHGLRHQFSSDLFFELTDTLPPVKGGCLHLSREVMDAAYQEIARQLGHNRPGISGAYLGSRSTSRCGIADGGSTGQSEDGGPRL